MKFSVHKRQTRGQRSAHRRRGKALDHLGVGLRFATLASALLMTACSKQVQLPVHEFQVPAPATWKGAATEPGTSRFGLVGLLGSPGLGRRHPEGRWIAARVCARLPARIEAAAQERLIVGRR